MVYAMVFWFLLDNFGGLRFDDGTGSTGLCHKVLPV